MTKIYRYVFILILLFIISPAKNQRVYAGKIEDMYKLDVTLSTQLQWELQRNKYIQIDKLIDLLNIKPGMTILDIGTGIGLYAYKFAERLKGTGKVFATDIDSRRIDYVTKEAHKRGLTNIYPVLVKKEGVDEFYSKNKYDLILVFHVYFYFVDPVNYFKKMKNFLAKDGQLAVLTYNNAPSFSSQEIIDFKGLIKELLLEPTDNPFYNGLRESTRRLIKQQLEGEPDELLKNAIVDDFNQMLLDPQFHKNFLYIAEQYYFLKEALPSSIQRDFASWLLMCLKEEEVLDKAQEDLDAKEIRMIKKLNRLFISQRFRKYLYKGGESIYLWGWQVYRYATKFMVKRDLERAGYTLKNEYDLLPYHDFLVFTAGKNMENK